MTATKAEPSTKSKSASELVEWIHRKLKTCLPERFTPENDGRPRDQEIMGWLHVVGFYPRYADNIEKMQLEWQSKAFKLAEENAKLTSALMLMLEAYEKHDLWCGHNPDAPGDGIHNRAARAAREALGK